MKTYHVFIASSLSFQKKERDLMEKSDGKKQQRTQYCKCTGTKKMETTI